MCSHKVRLSARRCSHQPPSQFPKTLASPKQLLDHDMYAFTEIPAHKNQRSRPNLTLPLLCPHLGSCNYDPCHLLLAAPPIIFPPLSTVSVTFLSLYRTARVHGAPEKQVKSSRNRSDDSDKNTFGPANNKEAKPLQKNSIESLVSPCVRGKITSSYQQSLLRDQRTRNRVKEASTKGSPHAENMQTRKNSACQENQTKVHSFQACSDNQGP